MIKNSKLLNLFDRQKLSLKESLKIFESLWKEAVAFKVLPSKDPLEGLDSDIKTAKILNQCLKNS